MSAIRIVKGLPVSLLLRLKDDTTTVNLNDGTWTVEVSLHYQVENGPEPFDITPSVNGFTLNVNLTEEQTSTLNHLGTGYVLVVYCYKSDDSVHIKNKVPVSVTDGL